MILAVAVVIGTSMGDIKVQLDEKKAPVTVANFLKYVKDKHYEGTVLQIVLQHQSAQDTPESLNLVTNKAFKREAQGNVEKYTDEKDGLIYTFVESRLKTTRYAYSMDRLARIQRGK